MDSQTESAVNTPIQSTSDRSIGDVETILLQHLKDKYGETFICEKISGKSILSSTYDMTAYPQSSDKMESFLVAYEPTSEKISDGYYGVIIRSEINEVLSENVKQLLEDYKLFVRLNASYFQDDLVKGISAKEAAERGQDMSLTVSIFALNQPDKFESLKSQLKSLGYNGIVQYFSLSNPSDFLEITDSNYLSTIACIQSEKVATDYNNSEAF